MRISDWSSDVCSSDLRYIQSKDRIHRYNPKGGLPVHYIYLLSEGTVDDDIDARLTIKERRLMDLVDTDEIPLLTAASDEDGIDDIRAVFESYERRKTKIGRANV